MASRILYLSGSIGLGHVFRDLAIARALRRQDPDVEISWIASHPATIPLREAGERLHPHADRFANDSAAAEGASTGEHRLDLFRYCMKASGAWWRNVQAFQRVTEGEPWDLVVADEAYEIDLALRLNLLRVPAPFAMIYDFIGCFPMTRHPLDLLLTRFWNLAWAASKGFYDGRTTVALFLGELEDVPDRSPGRLLPNVRDLAEETCRFVGYVLPFDPEGYRDRDEVRSRLGYGPGPLVVCTVGGSAVGRGLLELCGRAYPLLAERMPDLHMVLVCGPRLRPADVEAPPGVDVRGYVPRLYEHLAACDLAIVQGGGATTLELTALRRPFLHLPLEGHFEQRVHVAGRLARHGAGVEVPFSGTRPRALAELVVGNLGKPVTHPPIATDGAARAAAVLDGLLARPSAGPAAR